MELAKLEGPELKRLADSLPDTVHHSRADSTATKHLYAFKQRKVFPVQEVHFALYLQHLSESTQSKTAVQEAASAIGWSRQLAGLPSIVESSFVRATLAGLQCKLAKPKVKKEPCTTAMLTTLVQNMGPNPSLSDVCLAAYSLLSFTFFPSL